MGHTARFQLALFSVALALAAPAAAQEHEHGGMAGEKLGTVHFATSCSPAAQPQFDRAVALMHSFEFGAAIDGYTAAAKTDSGCAMAYWGIAISRWSNPFAAVQRAAPQLQQGLDAIAHAKQAGAKTERERDYIAAAERLYAEFDKVSQRDRVVAYEHAMGDLAAKYPEDREASIFYALSLAASALPGDKTYANQLKAGAILEKILVEEPDHPGITHYIIHSYDVPALAPRAVTAARRYGTIAPSAPHALHMPSHTFTRVGFWQESIDTNIKSAAAAKRERAIGEELHASDYQMYAYLQTAQDAAARTLLDSLPEINGRSANAVASAAPPSANAFALAAMPARYALERQAWAEAATLPVTPGNLPYTEAMTHFARALGAARVKDLTTAKASVDALERLRDKLTQMKDAYWAEQVEIERRGAAAWMALAEGRSAEALELMRSAATLEDGTEKNAVTPGPLAPARELLGEMLLQTSQPALALNEFQATLKKEPNRFRSVYGAAHAAALAGDRATAATYYDQLLTICARADQPGRPELAEARSKSPKPSGK
jgi:hypothetical protein